MDVKEAVGTAKAHVTDLFAGEEIMNVGLEEVEFDGTKSAWRITIGFSRPWDQKNTLTAALGEGRPGRSYKVLLVDDKTGRIDSLTDRLLNASTRTGAPSRAP